ncbi:MAG: hypothetical protein U0528_06400 [Anaerolineae bacterium]
MTATMFTDTPTPDIQVTINAERTLLAIETLDVARTQTAIIVSSFTHTPMPTDTPTVTASNTLISTPTATYTYTSTTTWTWTPTPTVTATPTATLTLTLTPPPTSTPTLIPTATAEPIIVSSGNATLRGTYFFDFDGGQEIREGAEVWWEQKTQVERYMVSSAIAYLGRANFDSLDYEALKVLPYLNDRVDGSNNSNNLLIPGSVFAVRTDLGNYAKVQILKYGYNLEVRWVTYGQP